MSEIYMELGNDFIPMLKDAIDPLILKFSIIETH